METHTLARYISESTLQEYQFVDVKPSLIAASAMYLALRMKKLGPWVSCGVQDSAQVEAFGGWGIALTISPPPKAHVTCSTEKIASFPGKLPHFFAGLPLPCIIVNANGR